MCPRVSLLWGLRWDSAESWLPESPVEFPTSFGHLTHTKSQRQADFLSSACSPMPHSVGSTVSGGFSVHRCLVGLLIWCHTTGYVKEHNRSKRWGGKLRMKRIFPKFLQFYISDSSGVAELVWSESHNLSELQVVTPMSCLILESRAILTVLALVFALGGWKGVGNALWCCDPPKKIFCNWAEGMTRWHHECFESVKYM